MIVLDASAVLAAMLQEPGADRVHALVDKSVICAVNTTEVISKLIDKGYDEVAVRQQYENMHLEVVSFDHHLALVAGHLRSTTRHKGLSLGDRACLALAILTERTAVTADRKWADLDVGCKIEVIR
ncbi:PIN domain protein [Aminobacter sp. MSH1]|nr:PIN domain protein [Aminobacter sp. MSH1]